MFHKFIGKLPKLSNVSSQDAMYRCGQNAGLFVWECWGRLLTHPTQDYCSVPAVKHSQPQLQVWPAHPGTLPSLPVTSRAKWRQTGTAGSSAWVHFIHTQDLLPRFEQLKTHNYQQCKGKYPFEFTQTVIDSFNLELSQAGNTTTTESHTAWCWITIKLAHSATNLFFCFCFTGVNQNRALNIKPPHKHILL